MGTQRAGPRTWAGPRGALGWCSAGGDSVTRGVGLGAGAGAWWGGLLQAANKARPSPAHTPMRRHGGWASCCNGDMWLLLLEALGALLIFVFIIWWTMFSGRQRGERRRDENEPPAQ